MAGAAENKRLIRPFDFNATHNDLLHDGSKSEYGGNAMKKIYTIAIAVFLVLSLISFAVAKEEAGNYWGEVASIDYHAKTVSIKAFSPLVSPDVTGGRTGITFGMDESTDVIKCHTSKDLKNIKVGDAVQIRYHEKNEKYIAESIAVSTPLTACSATEKAGN